MQCAGKDILSGTIISHGATKPQQKIRVVDKKL